MRNPPQLDLQELLKMTVEEEHRELETHHKRVVFFGSAISGLILGTLVGVKFATNWEHFLILSIIPLLGVPLSRLGRQVSKQFYERFLSAVTTRAKIEQLLGLTFNKQESNDSSNKIIKYWETESLVPTRNLESRLEYKESSKKWFQERMKGGYQRSVKLYFFVFELGTWSLSFVMLGIAISKLK